MNPTKYLICRILIEIHGFLLDIIKGLMKGGILLSFPVMFIYFLFHRRDNC